jgi:hypothetical protein
MRHKARGIEAEPPRSGDVADSPTTREARRLAKKNNKKNMNAIILRII